ncbi:MAG: DUF5996 family protein [Gemmatimonadales bacterium]
MHEAWPALTFESWRETYATLHMWTQIVGKTRLALAPMVNHWWQVALYVTERGLTTSPIPSGNRTFAIDFDFLEHKLSVRTSEGEAAALPLRPRSVADFYADYLGLLRSLDLQAKIWPVPVEVESSVRFPDDRTHASYDADSATRLWQVLSQADRVLKRFRGRFLGKASPVHFFWGSFDLAATRFSGRQAPPYPGGAPNLGPWVMQEAYSHECSSLGFWPGGGPIPEPVFYAYAYPEPEGFKSYPIKPDAARYSEEMREFVLPYDAVRCAPSPDDALLDFAETTYAAAADLGHWDRATLERPPSQWPR